MFLWRNYAGVLGADNPAFAWTINSQEYEMRYTASDGSGHEHQMLNDPSDWHTMYAVDGSGYKYVAPSSESI